MPEDSLDRARNAAAAAFGALVEECRTEIESFSTLLVEKFHLGRRLLLVGSGPLAAVADLTATLFQHRLTLNRPPLPVISLARDADLASSLLRDGLGRQLFSRPLRVVAAPDDVVLLLGDGTYDEALSEALDAAREVGCLTAVLTSGKWEPLGVVPDFLFQVEIEPGPRFTETALFFCHLLCEQVEARLFGM